MRETPPPLQPPLPSVGNDLFSSRRQIMGGAALAVLLLLALLLFRTQVQRDEPLNAVAEVPEQVSANDTENIAVRTEKIDKAVGGSSSTASVVSEPHKLPIDGSSVDYLENEKTDMGQTNRDEIVTLSTKKNFSNSNQNKDPARQSHDLENGQELSRFMPTEDEIASANRFVNLGGKVEFFGICTSCEHVAFLIDSSGSMQGPRFERVKEELLKSLRGLKQSQRFSVYLFKSSTVYKRKNCVVSPAEINNIQQELNRLYACGGTDPTDAIKEAVNEHSDVIFLLSDGKIRQSGKDIARLNRGGKIINTIAIGGDSQSLRDVARENGGEYRNAN